MKIALPIVQGGLIGGFGGNWKVPGSGYQASRNYFDTQSAMALQRQQLQRQQQSDQFKNYLDFAKAQHDISAPPASGAPRQYTKDVLTRDGKRETHTFHREWDPSSQKWKEIDDGLAPARPVNARPNAESVPQAPPATAETEYEGDEGAEVGTQPDAPAIAIPTGPPAAPQKPKSNPFEAFAYGNADEKQAAQDFLDFEKKTDARYEKPGDLEQRYSLYKRDPDAYKAMFGDRGSQQDQALATRMLSYFDKQKKEIQGDWQLDDATKAQRLSEIV